MQQFLLLGLAWGSPREELGLVKRPFSQVLLSVDEANGFRRPPVTIPETFRQRPDPFQKFRGENAAIDKACIVFTWRPTVLPPRDTGDL